MKFLGTPWNGASTNAITLTSTRPPMTPHVDIDAKALLMKYMEFVHCHEGTDFCVSQKLTGFFSDDESACLIELSNEMYKMLSEREKEGTL